jgi:hypothetical protein
VRQFLLIITYSFFVIMMAYITSHPNHHHNPMAQGSGSSDAQAVSTEQILGSEVTRATEAQRVPNE